VLAKAIVDIAANALLLALADDEDLLFKAIALGKFRGENGGAVADALLEGVLDGAQGAEKPDDDKIEGEEDGCIPKRDEAA